MFYPKSPFLKCPGIESQLFKRNKPDIFNLLEWLCKAPEITTYRVNLMNTSPEKAKLKIFHILKEKYTNPPDIYFHKEIPECLFISRIKDSHEFNKSLNEIIVDINCGAAVLRGAHIYGPGVIAMNTGTKIDESVNVFVDLDGKCKKGTTTNFESDKKVFIGSGKVKMQRYQLFGKDADPKGVAIEMENVISKVPSLGDLSSDELLLQNLPSMVCCRVLDPKPNEIILDMCAAPGNKTSHIVELTKQESIIIAIDKIKSKVQTLNKKVEEENWKNVYAFAFDSTKCCDLTRNDKSVETIRKGPPFPLETFDRILLDAPCSSLGNRPLLSCKMTEKMLKSYPVIQKKIFKNAVDLLKPGGTLVYSTCTIHEDENENIVSWAKIKFPQLELVAAEPLFGGPGIEHDNLTNDERHKLQRFSINNNRKNVDCIGFFIAKFVKSQIK